MFEVPVQITKGPDELRKYAEVLEYAREHRVENRELAESDQGADNYQS